MIVILLWGGSTHPAGVPMDDAIPLEEILRTWPIIRYVYERAERARSRMNRDGSLVGTQTYSFYSSLIYITRAEREEGVYVYERERKRGREGIA